jgi:hypothetical protein
MSSATIGRIPGWKAWIAILAIFFVAVSGAAYLGKLKTRAGNIEAAMTIAAGTAALALITRRYSGFPRWASVASVTVLAASAIGGAALWPDAAGWHHAVKDSLWMHPWYFLTLTGLGGSPRGACCGPASSTTGWMIVTGAVLIGVLVPVIAAVL